MTIRTFRMKTDAHQNARSKSLKPKKALQPPTSPLQPQPQSSPHLHPSPPSSPSVPSSILSHLTSFLRAYVLIGNHTNTHVVKSYQSGLNIFDLVIIDEILPKTSSKYDVLKLRNTADIYTRSGYKIAQSFYVQIFKFIQFFIILIILCFFLGLMFVFITIIP